MSQVWVVSSGPAVGVWLPVVASFGFGVALEEVSGDMVGWTSLLEGPEGEVMLTDDVWGEYHR